MYKPPKVTVVQFQIESGFAGSGPLNALINIDASMDNTFSYEQSNNSGSGFWDGGGSTSQSSTGTSSYGSYNDWSW